METLLMLQPIASYIGSFLTVIGVLVLFGSGLIFLIQTINEDIEPEILAIYKRVFKGAICCLVAALLCLPVAKSWDMYKNVLTYRAINSETTTKAIKNIDLLLDKWNSVLEKE